jgi:hypothetical protein
MTDREQEACAMLQNIARDVQKKLPDGMGFMVMAYAFGDSPNRKTLYVSNSHRADVMKAMIEFLEKNIEDPDMWGKDVD